MQYLVSVIDDTAGLATPDEQAAIDVFDDRLKAEGRWVFAGGLAAPSSATVIDNRGEEIAGRQCAVAAQSRGESLFAEFFARIVERFRDPVRVERKNVSCRDLDCRDGAIPFLEHTENCGCRFEAFQ